MHKRTKKQFPYRNRVWKIQIKSTLSVRNTVFGEIGLLIIRNLFPFLPIFPGNGMEGKRTHSPIFHRFRSLIGHILKKNPPDVILWCDGSRGKKGNRSMQSLLNSFHAYLQAGSVLSYAAGFAGGGLISFPPRVYPVLPITVGYIGGRSQGSKARGFFLSLSYVLGMAVTYAAIGTVAAVTGQVFGRGGASSA